VASGKNNLNRQFRAASALLLCVVITGTLLFSRLVSFSATDSWQYIPLTESNGITQVVMGTLEGEPQTAGFRPDSPVLLAASPFLATSWFRVTDKNTVWDGNTRIEIFRVSYRNGENEITVKSGRGDKVIAPGTENSYTFALENTAGGPVIYDMSMAAYVSNEEYSLPVVAKVSRNTDKTYLLGSPDSYRDVLELDTVSDEGVLSMGHVMPYTLSWQWPFEGDDTYDTFLGNLAESEDLTLTIVIQTHATFCPDEDVMGGIPKTGDTSHIEMWFTVMLASAAGLMLLLLLMLRRKGEEHEAS